MTAKAKKRPSRYAYRYQRYLDADVGISFGEWIREGYWKYRSQSLWWEKI